VGKGKKQKPRSPSMRDLLRLSPGQEVRLGEIDTRLTPGSDGDKDAAADEMAAQAPRLADLQERLFAEGRSGGRRSVLLVLQGMDTAGKGGTVRHVVGAVDPQGVSITSFKAPTREELAHDFLWRIRRRLPEPGMLGVFDRSHYEDVVVVRVRELVERRVWSRRYDAINRFEQRLVANGTTIVKCFLHISAAESKERLLARLDDPEKHWKFNPDDVDNRALWDDYMTAYADALQRCSTEHAPWYVVPADRKWYRNLAVMRLLVETFEAMELTWPKADFDVDEQRRRLVEAD
jgi:PPK2 family polyphosphate:nucleotide phosphotransferase